MDVLYGAVGKTAVTGNAWCKAVLEKEKRSRSFKTKASEEVHARPQSSDGLAAYKQQNVREKTGRVAGGRIPPSTPSKGGRVAPQTPQTAPQQGRLSERRKQVRSMMF